jgi:hypothetical protein
MGYGSERDYHGSEWILRKEEMIEGTYAGIRAKRATWDVFFSGIMD